MIALAILVIAAAHHRPERIDPRHDQLVPISIGELRRLIAITIATDIDPAAAICWFWWRRRHQATARRSQYKRRDAATST